MREEPIRPFEKAVGNRVLSSGWEQGIVHEEVETTGGFCQELLISSPGHSRRSKGLGKAGHELDQGTHGASVRRGSGGESRKGRAALGGGNSLESVAVLL